METVQPIPPAFRRRRLSVRAGFTLTEVMIAMALSMLVLGVGASILISLTSGSARVAEYAGMNNASHRAVTVLSDDVRMAVDVTTAQAQRLVIERPSRVPGAASYRVIYEYEPTARVVYRTEGSNARTAFLVGVSSFDFHYFTIRRDPTSHPREVKEVQIDAVMERSVRRVRITNHIISARFMMRNRALAA